MNGLRIPDPREKPWLTVKELAEITGEGEKVLRGAISAGQLPHLAVGRYVRIPTAALRVQLGIDPESTDGESPAQASPSNVRLLATKTPPGGDQYGGDPA